MAELAAPELQRYARQLILPDWGQKAQLRLRRATVFVAGAGGLGSPVVLYLAAAGVGRLRVCDGAEVELSNLNRQILYSEADVGHRKAELIAGIVTGRNPLVKIEGISAVITSDNIDSLVGGVDVILDCLDNFPARLILNEHAVRRRIPMVHAGVYGWAGQVTFLHPPRTPCLACLLSANPPDGNLADRPIPIIGVTAGVVGSIQATEALRFLAGKKPLLSGRILFWDGARMSFHISREKPDPLCPVCGKFSPKN
ncbi:MAG: hypothetical protein A2Y38_04320 [Spirochaetes bacterium GWB1_59_5]|nr:MAG: hypothetical protein A2Y38_04320 [Spirochaetes bacterium GWB1_59_5]